MEEKIAMVLFVLSGCSLLLSVDSNDDFSSTDASSLHSINETEVYVDCNGRGVILTQDIDEDGIAATCFYDFGMRWSVLSDLDSVAELYDV